MAKKEAGSVKEVKRYRADAWDEAWIARELTRLMARGYSEAEARDQIQRHLM